MPPLRAPELHRVLRQDLGRRMLELGFERTPKMTQASWCRPEGAEWLVIWFQPSAKNYALGPGFHFTVELLLVPIPTYEVNGYGQRLPTLLDHDGREELRRLTNQAISKLPAPDADFAASLPEGAREWYLEGWKPVTSPVDVDLDAWMRQGDEADVHQLTEFIGRVLPGVIDRFLHLARAWRPQVTLRDAD